MFVPPARGEAARAEGGGAAEAAFSLASAMLVLAVGDKVAGAIGRGTAEHALVGSAVRVFVDLGVGAGAVAGRAAIGAGGICLSGEREGNRQHDGNQAVGEHGSLLFQLFGKVLERQVR